jgi:hypothetical protein
MGAEVLLRVLVRGAARARAGRVAADQDEQIGRHEAVAGAAAEELLAGQVGKLATAHGAALASIAISTTPRLLVMVTVALAAPGTVAGGVPTSLMLAALPGGSGSHRHPLAPGDGDADPAIRRAACGAADGAVVQPANGRAQQTTRPKDHACTVRHRGDPKGCRSRADRGK